MKEAFIRLLNSATKSIEIAVYNLKDRQVIEALNDISARGGVTIRVVTDDGNFPVRTSDLAVSLAGARITVRKDDDYSLEMHHKFVIIDRGESGAAVWTGSANFNRPNFTSLNNNALILWSSAVATAYGAEFDLLWSGKYHQNKNPFPSAQTNFTVAGIPIEIRFAPQDRPLDRLISAVGAASSSLHWAIFTYGNSTLKDAMLAKYPTVAGANFGLYEKTQLDFGFSNTSFYNALRSKGYSLMKDVNPDDMHHKYAVIDGLTVFTGSMNFTTAGNEQNDENSIVIRDAEVAKYYLAELARITGQTFGAVSAADWKESVLIGSPTSTPLAVALIEPAKDRARLASYPNPFRLGLDQEMTIATTPLASITSVKIYSVDGRLVYTLIPGTSRTSLTWNGRTAGGDLLASGMYMIEIETRTSGVVRGRITLVR
jgi:phosphatidylserine/phosphatidylglycerophosphate/cardiolipin synthase-like enzyme